jgi:hypothetical protein
MRKLLCVAVMLWASPVAAQFCPPYCGPPAIGPYDPYGYKRGPLGDYIDRRFYCQGPCAPSGGQRLYEGWRGNNYPWIPPQRVYPPPRCWPYC